MVCGRAPWAALRVVQAAEGGPFEKHSTILTLVVIPKKSTKIVTRCLSMPHTVSIIYTHSKLYNNKQLAAS